MGFGAAPTKVDEVYLLPLTVRHIAALPPEAVTGHERGPEMAEVKPVLQVKPRL
ncbi:hypothetical protein [Candidatus Rhodobacter oscarellae]|nr:hypothetical protein [Candidatus Rhodobacter lobularis]